MNILTTITSYPPATGGSQLHLHQLNQQLTKRHTIQVATFWDSNRTDWLLGTTINANQPGRRYEIDDIPVNLLGFTNRQKLTLFPWAAVYYFLMPLANRRIAELIQPQFEGLNGPFDLIHNIRQGREPLTEASMQFAHKKGLPFVFTPLHHPRWQGPLYRVYHRIYREADALIALTGAEKKYLISVGVKEERIHVLGNGPVLSKEGNAARFHATFNIPAPFVLFLGRHFAYKGYKQVLQAAPLVWKDIPETHFVFIGPPTKESKQIFSRISDSRIHQLGIVDIQVKTDALDACTLLCVPSSQESFGGVYTEAWMMQKPVIGCTIPAVQEVIADESDGYIIAQDPNLIAGRIKDLILDPQKSLKFGKCGYQKTLQNYTWEALAGKLEDIYIRLTHGQPDEG